MRRIHCAALVAACLLATPAFAETLAGPYVADILRVIDGDTFHAKVHVWLGLEQNVKIRLRGIDAPELHGRCPGEPEAAAASRDYLAALLGGDSVQLTDIGVDKYGGRVDAAVRLPNGQDVGAAMLASGHARPMKRSRVSWCRKMETQ